MDFDFSSLCADQSELLAKRLTSLTKKYMNEYQLALDVLNNENANDKRDELMVQIEDLFNDQVNKAQVLYIETLNKVQRKMREYII